MHTAVKDLKESVAQWDQYFKDARALLQEEPTHITIAQLQSVLPQLEEVYLAFSEALAEADACTKTTITYEVDGEKRTRSDLHPSVIAEYIGRVDVAKLKDLGTRIEAITERIDLTQDQSY